jgi:hypothetical protein
MVTLLEMLLEPIKKELTFQNFRTCTLVRQKGNEPVAAVYLWRWYREAPICRLGDRT